MKYVFLFQIYYIKYKNIKYEPVLVYFKFKKIKNIFDIKARGIP